MNIQCMYVYIICVNLCEGGSRAADGEVGSKWGLPGLRVELQQRNFFSSVLAAQRYAL